MRFQSSSSYIIGLFFYKLNEISEWSGIKSERVKQLAPNIFVSGGRMQCFWCWYLCRGKIPREFKTLFTKFFFICNFLYFKHMGALFWYSCQRCNWSVFKVNDFSAPNADSLHGIYRVKQWKISHKRFEFKSQTFTYMGALMFCFGEDNVISTNDATYK